MRPFRSVRQLVIPVLAIPLVLSTVMLPGSAWAKGSKTVTCRTLNGTYGGSWTLDGCGPVTIVGTGLPQATVSGAFPASPATITWGAPVDRHAAPLMTTISFTVSQRTGHKNKCGAFSQEYVLAGTILSNSASPGVKGKVKMFVCDLGGVLSQKKKLKL